MVKVELIAIKRKLHMRNSFRPWETKTFYDVQCNQFRKLQLEILLYIILHNHLNNRSESDKQNVFFEHQFIHVEDFPSQTKIRLQQMNELGRIQNTRKQVPYYPPRIFSDKSLDINARITNVILRWVDMEDTIYRNFK